MHLFTITVQSNFFGKELSDDVLEEMAFAYLDEMTISLERHGLSDLFEIEAYWRRGCLVEQFMLVLQSVPLIELFSLNMAYKGLKEYKRLREGVVLVSQDLRRLRAKIAGEYLSAKKIFICDTKPSPKAKKIERKGSNKDLKNKATRKNSTT